jgi:hypothetical protein
MSDGGVLGKRMRMIGWVCLAGSSLVLFDLVVLLPTMPSAWWGPPRPMGPDGVWDLRIMFVDFGLGWLGSPGYLGALVWIPLAILSAVRARRRGVVPTLLEWSLFASLAAELILTSCLVHLTPLRYASYNIPLL